MSAESDALRDALSATDPTEEQKQLRAAYELAGRILAEQEREAAEEAKKKMEAAEEAKKKKEAEEEADRVAAEEAEAEALQAAQDEADAKAERDAELAAQREKEIEKRELQQFQFLTGGLDNAQVARWARGWEAERRESQIRQHDRLLAKAAEEEREQEAKDLADAERERQERQAADAERLDVDWDPDATGKAADRQVVALSNARFDEAIAKRDAEFAQRRTIQRLAGRDEVEFDGEGEPESARVAREAREAQVFTPSAAQRLAASPDDQARAQRAAQREAREAQITNDLMARASVVGLDWNAMPATAREAAQQRRELDERERALGIAPQERGQDRSIGIEI